MHLDSIIPYNFRNLANESIRFSTGLNLFIGRNGQGKTNLLEAVALLSAGRSFRGSRINEFVQWDCEEASVFGKAYIGGENITLGISFKGREREFYINHQSVQTLKEYVGRISLVTFSPLDIQLVKGPPSERRTFLDKHLVDVGPEYFDRLVSFHRALRNKNALLKSGTASAADLDPWNKLIAEAAAKITDARRSFIEVLRPQAKSLYGEFSHSDAQFDIELKSSCFEKGDESASPDAILKKLNHNAERELRTRACLIGPHRDDVMLHLHGKDARSFASQGESRSIVLAIKMAVIHLIEERRQESPVVLLDDVDAELDESRRAALLKLLVAAERQIMISGTDRTLASLNQDRTACCYEVSGGRFISVDSAR